MSTKLYRAIVGIGISLGATSVACLGNVESLSDVGDDGGSEAAASNEAGAAADSATSADSAADARAVDATTTDASVDATTDAVDVSADAPNDAILDAFCDAAWPTTKGSGGPTCGPLDSCADSGPAPSCIEELGPFNCNSNSTKVFPAWCFGGEWECSAGSIPVEQCKCWGPLDAGQSCP